MLLQGCPINTNSELSEDLMETILEFFFVWDYNDFNTIIHVWVKYGTQLTHTPVQQVFLA